MKQNNYPRLLVLFNGRFHRALITKDFVFYVNFQEGDENGCCEMYRRLEKSNPHDRDDSKLELVSNNYFANVGLIEELAKGKDNWEYISPTMKANYKLAKTDGFFDEWNA